MNQREYITDLLASECELHNVKIAELSRMMGIEYHRLWCVIHGQRVMYPEELTNLMYVFGLNQYNLIPVGILKDLEEIRRQIALEYW